MTELTPQYLKKLCREKGWYSTPHLNDRLYLHFKGIKKIEALDEYNELKCLWLEGNGTFDCNPLKNHNLTGCRKIFSNKKSNI